MALVPGAVDAARNAAPNAAHVALARLEAKRREVGRGTTLVTQNVDGLHRAAGSLDVIEVHGSAQRVRCKRRGCVNGDPHGSLSLADLDLTAFRTAPLRANVPRCPKCGSLLRPHVLWFDELYTSHVDYGWKRVRDVAQRAATVVFVGTSFSVGVTDFVLGNALRRGWPVFNVDPHGRAMEGVTLVTVPAEDLLPRVC